MADISISEESFCSWHTCNENNKNIKTNNENIIKDLNLEFNNSDDDNDSFSEFEKIVDQSVAFKNFREKNNSEDFLRPLTPHGSIKRENNPLVQNFLRPKYLSGSDLQQNISLADKSILAGNIETSYDIPTIKVNDKKTNLLAVPKANLKENENVSKDIKNNLLSANQTSSMTLIEPEMDIAIPSDTNSAIKSKEKPVTETKDDVKDNIKDNIKNDVENDEENLNDEIEDFKDSLEEIKENVSEDIANIKEDLENKTNETIENNENNNENGNEYATSTLGRLFGYFRSLGRNNNQEKEKENEIKGENENLTMNVEETNDLHTLKVPAVLGIESSSLTVVNDELEEDESDEEFVNALDTNINEINNNINNEEDIFYTTKTDDITAKYNNINYNNINFNNAKQNNYNGDFNNPITTDYTNGNDVQNTLNKPLSEKTVSTKPNEMEDDDYSNASDEFVDAVTTSNIIVANNNDSQPVSNVPPMGLPKKEGTVKPLKNMNKQPTNTTITPLNVELVPVNKPIESKGTGIKYGYFDNIVYEDNDNIVYEEDNNNTITRPSRKTEKKKQKKRKWYRKIFSFALCTRHKD